MTKPITFDLSLVSIKITTRHKFPLMRPASKVGYQNYSKECFLTSSDYFILGKVYLKSFLSSVWFILSEKVIFSKPQYQLNSMQLS